MEELELNKVYFCDCLEGMKKLKDNTVDLVITDPPYNISYKLKDINNQQKRKRNVFNAEWDEFENLDKYKEFIREVLRNIKRVIKPKGQIFIFFSRDYVHWFRNMLEEEGFIFLRYLIWYKRNACSAFKNALAPRYEFICWARDNRNKGKVKLNIKKEIGDVFDIPIVNIKERKEAGLHPCAKPVKLLKQLIEISSEENDLVLDCFMGSGSTAKACKETNRNFIGFEKDIRYKKIIEKRLMQRTIKQKTLKEFS